MKEMKRVLALVLCCVMLIGVLPVGAMAAEAETTVPSETEATLIPETTAAAEEPAATETPETTGEAIVPEGEGDSEVFPEDTYTEEIVAPVVWDYYAVAGAAAVVDDQVTIDPSYGYTVNEVTVYKKVSEIVAGKEYLIVNSDNGSGYGLDGDTTGYPVSRATDGYYLDWDSTAKTGTSLPAEEVYTTGTGAYLWTVGGDSGAYTFAHGSAQLGTSGTLASSHSLSFSTGRSWSYSSNALNTTIDGMLDDYTYHLVGGNKWSVSRSGSAQVYFYEPVTVYQVTEGQLTQGGTYTLIAVDQKIPTTVPEALISTDMEWSGPEAEDTLTWEASYELVSDPDGILRWEEGYAQDGNLVVPTTGAEGVARIGVTYTSGELSVYKEFSVTTYEPVPSIEIVNVGTVDPIEDVIVIKGSDAMAKEYPLDYALFDQETGDQLVPAGDVKWSTDDASIAVMVQAIDPETNEPIEGAYNVRFTGGEGVVAVTVSYTFGEESNKKTIEDTISFSVSKSTYIIPSDGTDDFPEYPAEGAIRINKTAAGVGSFSQTGVAQVELSMTGVPYDTGKPVDVIIMVDMSGSMNANNNDLNVDRVTPAKKATIAALKALVRNEAGAFNQNRVAIHTFSAGSSNSDVAGAIDPNNNRGCDLQTFDAQKLADWIGTENTDGTTTGGYINSWRANAGTGYYEALSTCEEILRNARAEEGYNREQFVIFVTDGAPSTNFYYVNSNGERSNLGDVGSGDEEDVTRNNVDDYTEWYSYQMKKDGVEIYTIGVQLSETRTPTSVKILQKIAGTTAVNAETGATDVVNATDEGFEKYAKFVGSDVNELDSLFLDIVGEILQAATNITVEDLVSEHYSLILDVPAGVTLPDNTELAVEVVEYNLDADKNRVGKGTILERVVLTDTTKVTADADGNVVSINADTFTYDAATKNLTWKADKLDITELAIRYYVFLDGCTDPGFEAGVYPTNEYAHITYTNYKGNVCQKYFPVPQLTWQGAQVTYKFYLVNEKGQPVNRAGRVIPFAEAVYVTEDMTRAVTWNKEEGSQNMLAEDLLASANVPDVYALYDQEAYYEIRVYQEEGVNDSFKNYNYFAIDGSDTVSNKNTTVVFNTVAGTKYSDYGVYSAQEVGTVLNTVDNNGNAKTVTTTVQTNNIDYAATTVAFAVVWTKALQPDTVVMDYGLDVVIDVAKNDALESKIVAVTADAPDAAMNTGKVSEAVVKAMGDEAEVKNKDGVVFGTASVEKTSTQAVRFSLDKKNGMQFKDPAEFYYVSGVTYYDSNNAKVTQYMYSQVNVIPATSVYYEDEYVTLNHYVLKAGEQPDAYGQYTEDQYEPVSGWTANSESAKAVQDVDRPGKNIGFGADYDMNNVYGFDTAYAENSTYSMGSAAMMTLTDGMYATATFDFYGTGFDVISLTSSDTGLITVTVKNANGDQVGDIKAVDTYYGYEYGLVNATYKWDGYNWFLTKVEDTNETAEGTLPTFGPKDAGKEATVAKYMWHPDATNAGALYQVPVINVSDLPWGKYTVEVRAAYSTWLDHNESDESYNFCLDAIRIYDPMQPNTEVGNTTAGNIYAADNEGWPLYTEVRDILLKAKDFNALQTGEQTTGVIFIDDISNTGYNKSYSIDDYTAYGPNNEVYLAKGQTVAFELELPADVADVQIGLKTANGKNVYAVLGVNGTATNPASITNGNSATDRYYSIGNYVTKGGKTVLSITNDAKNSAAGSILSITKIKITYTSDPTAAAEATPFFVTRSTANTVLAMLNANAEEAPEALPNADLEVSVNGKNVKVGSNVTVKATTAKDVAYLTVNGEKIDTFKQDKKTGERTWTAKVKAEEAGDLEIVVTAYNAKGDKLDTVTQTVQVAAKNNGKVVGQLLDKLFG